MNYPTRIIQSYRNGIISRSVFVELFREWQEIEMMRKAILKQSEKLEKI
jgi:hypothetical protein